MAIAAMGRAGRLCLSAFVVGAVLALVALGLGPRTGLYKTLTVLSGSMAPGIRVGSVLIDTPEPPTQLRVGQVITYQIPVDDHHMVSHRVVRIVSGGKAPVFVTKGDANTAPDPWTARVDGPTLWRVRWAIPAAGRVLVALRGHLAHVTLLYGIPLLLAVAWLREIWARPGPARREGYGEPTRA